jgi:pimeloyl-ACP methyl ester carboxylesterase
VRNGPPTRIVLLPGWNEAARKMQTFVDGRNGYAGFVSRGFWCTIFTPPHDDTLRDQVDRFATYLDGLKASDPSSFPVATLGYSAGGLVNRAFLKVYPERAADIAATIQVGTPNAGLITNYALATLRLARMPVHLLADLDVASEFLTWLNGTSGTWVTDPDNPAKRRYRLDRDPWVMPPGHRFLHIVGRMPRYGYQSDGVVMIESATLGGAMRVTTIDDDAANHLNLGAVSNPYTTLFRRFKHDDEVWPRVVDLCESFLGAIPS